MNIITQKEIYSKEALDIAKKIIDNENKIKIIERDEKIILESDDDILIKKLMNEALHQDLRIGLIKKNSNIIKFIALKAITSAIGETYLKGNDIKKSS